MAMSRKDLPDECWEIIFNKLHQQHHSLLESPSLSCKRFLSITNTLRTSLQIFTDPALIGPLSTLFSRFPNLNSIYLRFFRSGDLNRLVTDIATSDLNLETLDFTGTDGLPLESWSTNLSLVSVDGFGFGSLDDCSIRCARNISTLEIHDSVVPDGYLHLLAKAGIPLKSFTLSHCMTLTFSGISSVLNKYSSLKSLSLDGIDVLTDEKMSDLSQFLSALVTICLDLCDNLTELTFFKLAKNCPLLEDISMVGTNLGGGGGDEATDIVKNPRIKSLNLENNPTLSDECLAKLASVCPSLEGLLGRGCRFLVVSLISQSFGMKYWLHRLHVVPLSAICFRVCCRIFDCDRVTVNGENFLDDTSTHGSHIGPVTIAQEFTTENVSAHDSHIGPPVWLDLYDFTREFTTENVFPSEDVLRDWITSIGKENGFVIIIKSSERMAKNRSPRMRFACERGGKYRPFINKAKDKGGNVKENGKEGKAKKIGRVTGTKKCECPVESEHAKLKSHISNCQANFSAAWAKMHDLVKLQITDIKGSFEKSLNCWQHQFRIPIFDHLRGAASQTAMGLMLPEIKKIDDMVVEDKVDCGCPIRRTHGLPYDGAILDLMNAEWNIFMAKMVGQNPMTHMHWMNTLKPILNPSTTSLSSPQQKVQTRGRKLGSVNKSMRRNPSEFEYVEASLETPNSVKEKTPKAKAVVKKRAKANAKAGVDDNSPKAKAVVRTPKAAKELPRRKKPKLVGTLFVGPYLNNFPEPIRPHVKSITDVRSDGNCGYRAVAYFMHQSEHNWKTCRNDLLLEVNNHYDLYENMTGIGGANKLRYRLSFFQDGPAPQDRWMIFLTWVTL
ncbi:hypothetical protein RHGRI_017604 [Rhododendron griersonianum]|uniref:Uncharacterized protein n=1 Tax=Rhododendron griersonianum TaxID=479676 RepID=A0AAV6JYC6_9ERIC|nr:hypothetical protein RHGRI_017604 [Rhododendron griersonianum]